MVASVVVDIGRLMAPAARFRASWAVATGLSARVVRRRVVLWGPIVAPIHMFRGGGLVGG